MNKRQLCYFAVLASLILLAATVVLWVLQIEDENRRLVPFLIGTIPLLLLVRGMLNERVKTYQVTVFVALLYLVHGSVELFDTPGLLAALEVFAALALMFSAAFHAKWMTRQE
ncbi:DUF2069 domain-containing protein [Solemya velum gill symbiont]|uniref:Membrane protein n=2 Tax=Solemya velum gill symbiont TaxID=2340 RepID=A0A0B0HDJ0_SOVGS|nr:DUF2069 domain-containing protein [Solemya velum gill symbiont]KHF25974.1 membrane protein [Solemya velum gill symbiont]OOY34488.1 hypothetical protein BOV88_10060 [Solemya velum gill symbiont]OOY37200.1 hypothetical protein BOV89_08900 [Solemya velum gill symbiont]OOY45231.1 hypothetical protein BOV92_06055 [Solemya velum gill symbiont]OOY47474.1 hypothetical protein BOV93_06745 [Solemya velum gill symbiont]